MKIKRPRRGITQKKEEAMTDLQLTAEQRIATATAIRNIRRHLRKKRISEKEFMDACFIVSLAMIILDMEPLLNYIRPLRKQRSLRDTWRWVICYGKPGSNGTSHILHTGDDITIWPGQFTLEQGIRFASDMEDGGFLRKLNAETRRK